MNSDLIPQNFFETLPEKISDFELEILNAESEKIFNLFRYKRAEKNRAVTAYFNEETKEFNLLITIDLFEFCKMEYISDKFDRFEANLKKFLQRDIDRLEKFDPNSLPSMIREKKLASWNFNLPASFKNMSLEIKPNEPFEITNGSFIIIDYCNVELGNSFAILYNIYRDEFFCEEKIDHQSVTNYDYDSKSLDELQSKLEKLFPQHGDDDTRQ